MTKKQKLDLKPIEINTPRAQKLKKVAWIIKIPIIKQIVTLGVKKKYYPKGIETQRATPIPINLTVGTYEDQIVPKKVVEHFIQKAGTIVLIDCPCRIKNHCENHDHTLGCTWMGKGAANIDLSNWSGARYATKEEALELERLAYEDGLVPHLGKLRGDAIIYDVLDYEDQLMSVCHCCSCCCVGSLFKYGPPAYRKAVQKMEGVTVKVDQDICVSCTKCFKVCIAEGMEMKNDKAYINQDKCMGCGRCESTCPNGAISISIDDNSRIDELIKSFESRVDISG